MKNNTAKTPTQIVAKQEAPASSVQSLEMGKMERAPRFQIPREIIASNHRHAYAAAYVAGFRGQHLAFVAPVVRNSIVRGYLTGERARQNWDRFTGPQFYPENRAMREEVAAVITAMLETVNA